MVDYTTYSDQDLIRRMQDRDERVLVEIYNRYWEKMLAVAFNRLGNLQEAEECVQDVLYKLWNLGAEFTLVKDELSGYLARAIRNQAFNILDKRRRQRLRAEGYSPADVVNVLSPERQLILQELERQIDQSIQSLPAQCRLVFTLSREQGLSNKQIAEKLQLSENTIKSHLKRANKGIRGNTELLTTLIFMYYFLQF